MPEQNDICSLCGKPNEQLLMLNCSHDPCIHCATKTFAEQVFVKGENKDVLSLINIGVYLFNLSRTNSS